MTNDRLRQSKVDKLDEYEDFNEVLDFSPSSGFGAKPKLSITSLQDTRNRHKKMKIEIDNSPGKEYGNTMRDTHESNSKTISKNLLQRFRKQKIIP